MDVGQDPREGIFPSLGLIISWLLAVAYGIAVHVYYHSQQGVCCHKAMVIKLTVSQTSESFSSMRVGGVNLLLARVFHEYH